MVLQNKAVFCDIVRLLGIAFGEKILTLTVCSNRIKTLWTRIFEPTFSGALSSGGGQGGGSPGEQGAGARENRGREREGSGIYMRAVSGSRNK